MSFWREPGQNLDPAKNGTDLRNWSVPIFASWNFSTISGFLFLSTQRIFKARFRAIALNRIPEQDHFRTGSLGQAFQGRLYRNISRTSFPKCHSGAYLARISIFGALSRPDPIQNHYGMTLNRTFSGQAK